MSRQHQESKRLFAAALSVPPGEREAFLRAETGEDAELMADVESLLEHHEALALEESREPGGLGGLREMVRSFLRACLRPWETESTDAPGAGRSRRSGASGPSGSSGTDRSSPDA